MSTREKQDAAEDTEAYRAGVEHRRERAEAERAERVEKRAAAQRAQQAAVEAHEAALRLRSPFIGVVGVEQPNLVHLPDTVLETLGQSTRVQAGIWSIARDRREPMTKQSVTIPESTWAAVEALAEAEGISRSAWLSRAADQAAAQQLRLAVARQAAQEYVAEYEDEHGPISDEARAAAREALGLDDEGAAAA